MSIGSRGLPRAEVPAAFDVGAAAYDGLVGANPGYHAHLRISARRMRLPDYGRGLRLLDAGCGTGISTAALLSVAPDAEIIAVDASAGMLAEAADKPTTLYGKAGKFHAEAIGEVLLKDLIIELKPGPKRVFPPIKKPG